MDGPNRSSPAALPLEFAPSRTQFRPPDPKPAENRSRPAQPPARQPDAFAIPIWRSGQAIITDCTRGSPALRSPPDVFNCVQYDAYYLLGREYMKTSLTIIIVSLVLAILATIVAESRASRCLSKRAQDALCWALLACCYGVCVGAISGLIGYFFHLREWLALVIAVPFGIPLLFLAARVGEA